MKVQGYLCEKVIALVKFYPCMMFIETRLTFNF